MIWTKIYDWYSQLKEYLWCKLYEHDAPESQRFGRCPFDRREINQPIDFPCRRSRDEVEE